MTQTSHPAPATASRPTTDQLRPGDFSSVLDRNIKALHERRAEDNARATAQEKVAEGITRFTGSMTFVYVHVAIVALWVAIDVGAVPMLPASIPPS